MDASIAIELQMNEELYHSKKLYSSRLLTHSSIRLPSLSH